MTEYQHFFRYPASMAEDHIALAAKQRTAVREMNDMAYQDGGKRLGPVSVFEDVPLVALPPENEDDWIATRFREPEEEGEEPTHFERILRAEIINPQATPDEAMHEQAALVIEKMLDDETDRSEWTREQWVTEAREVMAAGGQGAVRALLDNHVLSLIEALGEFEDGFAAMEPEPERPAIAADFSERLTDALLAPRPGTHWRLHGDGTCSCGWPGPGLVTEKALDRHHAQAHAEHIIDLLVQANALPQPEAVALPDGFHVGHCRTCGQIAFHRAEDGAVWHPTNIATPCPVEPEQGSDEWGEWFAAGNRPFYPGADQFVDDTTVHAPAPGFGAADDMPTPPRVFAQEGPTS